MAKFAQVGYGHDGRGIGQTEGGYTYIVNDNVRTGDIIVPIPATHSRSGKEIKTTAMVLSSTKNLARETTRSRAGQDLLSGKKNVGVSNESIRNELEEKGLIDVEYNDNGKAIGVDPVGLRDISTDKGIIVRNYGNEDLYKQQLEKGMSKAREQNKAQKETFDSYSKPFMGEQK